MTKQHSTNSPVSHPAEVDAGAPEITREMIDAGVAVYIGYCPDTGIGDALDRRMISEIFLAMRGLDREGANI